MARKKATPAVDESPDLVTTAIPRGLYKIRGNRSDTVMSEPEPTPEPAAPLTAEG